MVRDNKTDDPAGWHDVHIAAFTIYAPSQRGDVLRRPRGNPFGPGRTGRPCSLGGVPICLLLVRGKRHRGRQAEALRGIRPRAGDRDQDRRRQAAGRSPGFYTGSAWARSATSSHKDVDNMEMVVGHLWTRMAADFVVAAILLAAASSIGTWRCSWFRPCPPRLRSPHQEAG